MATCLIVENPNVSTEQAEEVMAHVATTGPVPPEGNRVMIAGPANPGWRVISLWDSQEDFQRFFAERLTPAYAEVGLSLEDINRTVFEAHTLGGRDLSATPQPA